MKIVLNALLIVVTLLAIGLTFYEGWSSLSRPTLDEQSNEVNINHTADLDETKQDRKPETGMATELNDGVAKNVKAHGQGHGSAK